MLQKKGSIDPRVLQQIRFINVVKFSEQIHRYGIASLNIDIVWSFVQFINVFFSLLSITSPVKLLFVLIFFFSLNSILLKFLYLV